MSKKCVWGLGVVSVVSLLFLTGCETTRKKAAISKREPNEVVKIHSEFVRPDLSYESRRLRDWIQTGR